MADIKSPRLLYFKGGLMLVVGVLASAILIAEHPSGKVVLLLGVAVWGFARAYYFAFYVVEHYVDSTYKYAGLIDFLQDAWRRRNSTGAGAGSPRDKRADRH
jgi:hypothetical protein